MAAIEEEFGIFERKVCEFRALVAMHAANPQVQERHLAVLQMQTGDIMVMHRQLQAGIWLLSRSAQRIWTARINETAEAFDHACEDCTRMKQALQEQRRRRLAMRRTMSASEFVAARDAYRQESPASSPRRTEMSESDSLGASVDLGLRNTMSSVMTGFSNLEASPVVEEKPKRKGMRRKRIRRRSSAGTLRKLSQRFKASMRRRRPSAMRATISRTKAVAESWPRAQDMWL